MWWRNGATTKVIVNERGVAWRLADEIQKEPWQLIESVGINFKYWCIWMRRMETAWKQHWGTRDTHAFPFSEPWGIWKENIQKSSPFSNFSRSTASAGDGQILFRTRKEKGHSEKVTESEDLTTNLPYAPNGTMEEIWKVEIGDRLGHISLCSTGL